MPSNVSPKSRKVNPCRHRRWLIGANCPHPVLTEDGLLRLRDWRRRDAARTICCMRLIHLQGIILCPLQKRKKKKSVMDA